MVQADVREHINIMNTQQRKSALHLSNITLPIINSLVKGGYRRVLRQQANGRVGAGLT